MNNLDNQPDDRDDLWELLGKAKQSAPSQFFSRNVLREIRQSPQRSMPEGSGLFSWFRKRWMLASACTLAVVLLSVNTARMIVHHTSSPVAMDDSQSAQSTDATKPGDAEVVAHLDELVAYEENSVWLEDSSK